MDNLAYLTIEERIALFKKNMAFSTSDAARKVTSIAEAAMSDIMDDDKFVKKSESKLDDSSVTYSEHCNSLKSAISKELRKTDKSPYESRFGNACSDYIYIAALSLASLSVRLEKEYYNNKALIYYCLCMTLGNYLDALIDISYDSEKGKPNTRRANQYRKLKKEFSELIDLSTPLCEAIGILLNQYSNSHAELDRLNHIQRCKSDLDRFIQMDEMREEYPKYEGDSRFDNDKEYESADDIDELDEPCVTEQEYYEEDFEPIAFVADDDFNVEFDEDYDYYDDYDDFEDDFEESFEEDYGEGNEDPPRDPESEDTELRDKEMLIAAGDPCGFFLSEARKLPDFSAKSPKRFAMGNENPNLLADNDYSPEGLKARAAELPPEFREIADEVITAEGIASAFKGMDAAIDKLYRLLIEPFAEIEKYCFNRHLASEV